MKMNQSVIDLYAYDHVYHLLFIDGASLCVNQGDNRSYEFATIEGTQRS